MTVRAPPAGGRWAAPIAAQLNVVMPGLVPGIHVLCLDAARKVVDGRDKPGHDEVWVMHS